MSVLRVESYKIHGLATARNLRYKYMKERRFGVVGNNLQNIASLRGRGPTAPRHLAPKVTTYKILPLLEDQGIRTTFAGTML